jgi:tetratricopeptide (TPR) repeat protein
MPRFHTLPALAALAALLWLAPNAGAQGAPAAVAALEAKAAAGDLRGALAGYRDLLARAPEYSALCHAARIAVDLAEFEPDRARKDSLYADGLRWARQAVAQRPDGAEGHFHVARALGHTALGASPRERVRLAVEVKERARTALRLAPDHAGAHHVIGVWHAEVMRLNGLARRMARTFLGGAALAEASWDEAVRGLERAVALEPARIVHRLDLARIYADVGRRGDAIAQLDRIGTLASADPNDPQYRKAAAAVRAGLR